MVASNRYQIELKRQIEILQKELEEEENKEWKKNIYNLLGN